MTVRRNPNSGFSPGDFARQPIWGGGLPGGGTGRTKAKSVKKKKKKTEKTIQLNRLGKVLSKPRGRPKQVTTKVLERTGMSKKDIKEVKKRLRQARKQSRELGG